MERGLLFQRAKKVFFRGHELFTIQEIKLANKLQQKFKFGYLLVRVLAFFVKLGILSIIAFIASWIIFIGLAIVAFCVADFSPERRAKEKESREESYGTVEHMTKYPGMYD